MQIAERVGSAKAAEMVFLPSRRLPNQMLQWNVVQLGRRDAEFDVASRRAGDPAREGPTKAFAATKRSGACRLRRREGRQAKLYDLSMPLFETEDARIALRNAAEAINAGKPSPRLLCRQVKPGGEMPDVPSWTSIR